MKDSHDRLHKIRNTASLRPDPIIEDPIITEFQQWLIILVIFSLLVLAFLMNIPQ